MRPPAENAELVPAVELSHGLLPVIAGAHLALHHTIPTAWTPVTTI